MKVYKLNYLLFWIISAIDAKISISIDEVTTKINDGTILDFLEKNIRIDLSMLKQEDRFEVIEQWQRDANAIEHEGMLGIKNNGLCLLASYITQDINILVLDRRI